MKNLRRVPAFFLLIAAASTLAAQSFHVRTYDESDGLLNTAVNGIAQDSSGRMWFTSRGGITVYDGAYWETYTASNGLAALSAYQIRPDGRGSMWVIGQNPGWILMRYDGSAWTSHPFPPLEKQPSRITALAVRAVAGETAVGVGTNGSGVLVFKGSGWDIYTSADGLPGNAIRGLDVLEDGFVAATDGGLAWIGPDGVERRWDGVDPLLHRDIRGVSVEPAAGGEKIWILGDKILGILQEKRFELILKDARIGFSETHPHAVLLPDRQGGLIIGNFTNIQAYDPADRSSVSLGIQAGLIAEGATSLCLDRENNIWIAGHRGVSRISNRTFLNYDRSHGLLDNEVTAIRTLGDGVFVFGHNQGISILSGGEFRSIGFELKPEFAAADIRVLDMSLDDNGGVWIAGGALGLGLLSTDGRYTWMDFRLNPSKLVTSVLAAEGNRLWISQTDALYLYSNGRAVNVTPEEMRGTYIRKIVPGPDRTIFVCTSGLGIFRWDGVSWTNYTNTSEPGADDVYSVLMDSSGRILAGTIAGLYALSGGKLVRFSENGFELRRPVYLILEDKPGRIWFGTDNGLIRWDGRTRRDYSKADGLAGREVNRAAGCVDAAGRIWIGTNDGVSCYRERYDRDPMDMPPPLIAITGLDVNGESVDFTREITLGYRQNNLTFHFLGTSFLDESRLRFESRLDGFDKSWGPEYAAVDRQIRYTNLPHGTYVFHLRAKNAAGTVSGEVISPVIRIRNPFWLQPWFIVTAVLLGSVLILSFGLAVTQHRQAERLEALVRDRTAQIQASLRDKEVLLKEIHHRVKNNLQIVSSLLYLQSRRLSEPGAKALFQESISRIRAMALVHESLYRSDRLTAIAMEDYLRKLADHLVESYAGRDRTVAVSVRAEGISLPLETAVIYGLIINELVSNALKHAFPGNREGRIAVTLQRAEEETSAPAAGRKGKIVLAVADNGIGLPGDKKNGSPDSLGMRLVQNLTAQLDGTIEVLNGGGTEIRIAFPE